MFLCLEIKIVPDKLYFGRETCYNVINKLVLYLLILKLCFGALKSKLLQISCIFGRETGYNVINKLVLYL